VPRLIVIKGTDEGRQFALAGDVVGIGRDSASAVRLTDTEVSRRHAELVRTPDGLRIRDVGSANGTYLNNQSVRDALLQPGDHLQVGQTVLVYALDRGEQPATDLADRISLIARPDTELSSAIVKSIAEAEGSRILSQPDKVEGPWLHNARALGVLYEATQTISHTLDIPQLLDRLLELIFRTTHADRGCILLRSADPIQEGFGSGPDPGPSSSGELEPMAVRWRDGAGGEKIPVSRTVVDHVLRERQGILVNDALRDERFQAVQSIVRSGVREVICVPMKGRHQTLGVLYLDTTSSHLQLAMAGKAGKFDEDQLALATALAHQAALAVEETRYHRAMAHAERLAAVGQTVAALSHDLKNMLQGLMTGGEMIDRGLNEKDEAFLQQGWRIVRKNQGRIHELVMNMLSYSKEREPAIEAVDLNALAREVVELLLPRAKERGVGLGLRLDESLPLVPADPTGLHRALLNVVANALDAAGEVQQGRVLVGTQREPVLDIAKGAWVRLLVKDNGPGIPQEKLADVFRPFVSTKGAKGTGLGLAVSRKILREHGGDVVAESLVGKGSLFSLRLPLRSPLGVDPQGTRTELPVTRPPAGYEKG
jgi:signal transduction histidine kinase